MKKRGIGFYKKCAIYGGKMKFEVIDLFSGAGGVTTGIEQAYVNGLKIAKVIAAINHDEVAIRSHFRNHSHVKHFVEDIRNFDVKRLPKVNDPTVIKFLWASLECTNHSNAKGGLSRDGDSRTLAEHLPHYIQEFNPEYIGIENVREFLDWCPLIQKMDSNGKLMFDNKGKPYMIPDLKYKGKDFQKWVKSICKFGYRFEKRILNAADYGAHTSRKRLFIIFAKKDYPIAWPEPTHDKFGKYLKKWRSVKECLDFNDKGGNIFGRKKDLCENTYKRIYSGLIKFVANGNESFLTQFNGGDDRNIDIASPYNTITTMNRFAMIQTEFLMKYHGTGKNILSTNNCCSTLTTKDRLGLVSTQFIDMQHDQGQQNQLETGRYVIQVENTDSEYIKKIKMFMAAYGIIAIYMRMLRVDELKKITGLPDNYILEGSQADQKKFIGNAVPPIVPQMMFETLWSANNLNRFRVAI